MSQQVQANEIAVNVAYFLRKNPIIKERSGLLNGSGVDFFRLKRAVRALLSEDYKKKSANPKNKLPEVKNELDARRVFAVLINSRLVLRGQKLHTNEAREKNLAPKKGSPCFVPMQQAELKDDEYYIWLYQKKSVWDSVMSIGLLVGVLTLICFPLWPQFMRKGVWYLSMLMLGLLALLFVTAIFRLILFILTYFIVSPGIWLFPNLFEDVSFLDSFKPFYAWNEPKQKRSTKKTGAAKSDSTPAPVSAATPASAPVSKAAASTTGSTPSAGVTTKRKVVLEEIEE